MNSKSTRREGTDAGGPAWLPGVWAIGDREEDRFLRRMALAGSDTPRLRQILTNRFAPPADAESEVVFESCVHRVRGYTEARTNALRTLEELFARDSRVTYTVTDAGWLIVLEYLFGQKGITDCTDELLRLRTPFPEAHACRSFLVICRLGLTFPLPGTAGRDSLLGWLVLDGWEQRQVLEALFRQYAHSALAKSDEGSMDPVAWSTEIFSLADRLFREDPLVPAWGWLDAEFRLSSLLAPVDEWAAAAVAREQGLPDASRAVLLKAFRNREEVLESSQLRTDLHLDLAASAPGLAAGRVERAAKRILGFRIPKERLFEPGRIGS